jgi:excisionase family DNA binding protein
VTGQLLTVEQVAELCGLSRRSVYRAVDAGELVAYRPRGRVRIPEAALEAWLEACRVTPRQRPHPTVNGAGAPATELRRLLLPDD